jgi:CRISPR-associated endonuclease/helicase Cas3
VTTDLRPEEFHEYFEALHGAEVRPFPWQERLAETVFARGWPRVLDIPTGAGKTAAIDIAVFHLALEATRGAERRAAVRILFVVDRRLIVDEAYRRAERIANQLAEAIDGVLKRVADRLHHLAEKDRPLMVARLRGGMPKEPDWVRTPAQPTVVVSTVDQVGSRLLFRGYGVSDAMKPIHAGLLGGDALLLLDEAHLSQPFVQTARDTLIFRRAPWSQDTAPAPFHIVRLSATQADDAAREAGEERFRITDADRADERLRKRLGVSKPAELIETKAGGAVLAGEFADKAWKLSTKLGGACVVAVVVNRVKRARAIFEALQRKGARPFGETEAQENSLAVPETALLIGRVRDLDRDDLLQTLLPLVEAGPHRQHRINPLIVVATQCIEAGANLDFDALVTEIAPLDCLRQRFGRLNRMGREIDAQAAIIAPADQIAKSAAPDPIYGEALRHAWNLIVEKSEATGRKKDAKRIIDFGIEHTASWFPEGEALKQCLAPHKSAPVLLPSAIDCWSRTSPIPGADPEVALYLHGPDGGAGDVEIVWRADIDDDLDEEVKKVWIERVGVCPPTAAEAISVPIAEARRWLGESASGDIPDTEAASDEPRRQAGLREHPALRWRGADNDQTEPVTSSHLRPGDVIVVPASRGGCDRWGWAPESKDLVRDLGREANLRQRGRDILRLTRASPELALTAENEAAFATAMEDWSDQDLREEFAKHLEGAHQTVSSRKVRVLRASDGKPLALERKLISGDRTRENDSAGDAVTEDDESVRTLRQRRVTLSEHSQGVEKYARRFAEQAGLPAPLVEDVGLAAYLHDAGKAHPAFKRFLYGGDEIATLGGPDLAKSARLPDSPRAWDDVRRRAGLPRGARHEVASLRFAEAHRRFALAHDSDLVLWLIGTHHGHGRPFFPAPEQDWPGEGATFETDLGDGRAVSKPARALADLTAAWLDLCERLKRPYTPWGLARLEAILRLADHRRSEAEQEEEP